MTDLATNVTWGTGPTIPFAFAYEHERVGSTMRYKLQIDCSPITGTHYFGYPIYLEISLDGKVLDTHTLKAASPKQWSDAISYTTGWLEVSKVSGTTALTIRIYSGSGSSRNVKYSYSLPVIATASTVSATDANIGRTCSIIISRASQSLRHTLSYKVYGQAAYTTIVSRTAEAVVSWTVPTSIYALIPDTSATICTIKCDTYSGDTLLGSSECQMIASAAESECAPTVSATAVDVNAATVAVTGNEKIVVKGYSTLAVKVTATPKNGASIDKITVVCGSKSVDATSGSATIESADSATVTVTARDSRGFSTAYIVPGLSFVGYTPCWIVPEITRPEATGDSITLTVTGSCYVGVIGQSTNSITLRLRTKPREGEWSEWFDVPCTVTDGKITAEETYSGYDYNADYTAEVEIADLIMTPIAKTVPIKRGIPVYWWGEDHFTFNVPIRGTADADGRCPVIEGGLIVRGGDVLILSGIGVVCASDVTLKSTKKINLDGEEIYLNGHSLADILAKIGLA